jgi:8-oxo-dGTP pyrophosphatase MutT (NUDIX family)
MTSLEKVTAFIIRQQPSGPGVLLFEHPTAGIQVPAGTVEESEEPPAAALREGREESGLDGLTLEAFLGSVDESPVIGDHFIARATTVYSQPNLSSFDWVHYRRGLTVKLLRRSNGFAHVTFEEPNRWPNPQYATYQITGWVPEDVLSETARRHFYLLSHTGQTPPRWEVAIDNHIFKPFWASLDSLSKIISPQAPWLEILRKYIGKP